MSSGRSRLLALFVLLGVLLPACGSSGAGRLRIVAAENFWGNIASQLAGDFATVTSIVTDPSSDPHEYQSRTSDARAFADADYVIINGAGYDEWASHVLDANPSSQRKVLVVGDLLHAKTGTNPHFWYSPDYVQTVAGRITGDLIQLEGADAAQLNSLHGDFIQNLQPWLSLIKSISDKYAATKVAATEDIIVYMAAALRFVVISPPAFMNAVAEGNDPSAASVAEFQDQLTSHQAALLIYNSQTVTPLTLNLQHLASQQNIPAIGISEIEPANADFQSWQTAQLQSIQSALGG